MCLTSDYVEISSKLFHLNKTYIRILKDTDRPSDSTKPEGQGSPSFCTQQFLSFFSITILLPSSISSSCLVLWSMRSVLSTWYTWSLLSKVILNGNAMLLIRIKRNFVSVCKNTCCILSNS